MSTMNNDLWRAVRFAEHLAETTSTERAVRLAAAHYGIGPETLRDAWIAALLAKKYLPELSALDRARTAENS